MTKPDINFLHLSDVHFGMATQGWLMPAFESAFFNDIIKLHKRTGGWNFVVFSGDLAQRASPDEYNAFSDFLKRLWNIFERLGCKPVLIPIPGNHDLQRPDRLDPTAKAMENWLSDADVRNAFWAKKPPSYWELVQAMFSNYSAWLDSLDGIIPLPELKNGILPGDISTRIKVGDYTVGIVGLNSAWLQIGGGDYTGKLHIDIRQILAVTEENPDNWCRGNDANFILTHHPLTWLSSTSRREWKSDIESEGRFDAHLFGHMHESLTHSLSIGGSRAKNSLQSASLFGLEHIELSGETRIHGYSSVGVSFNNSQKTIRIWPRTSVVSKSGNRKLIADFEFELDEDESFSISGARVSLDAGESLNKVDAPASFNVNLGNEIDRLKKRLPQVGAHTHVRIVEQEAALLQLNEHRVFWLISDWGSGEFEFIRAVTQRLDVEPLVFQIECENYRTRKEFLSGVKATYGISFEKICESLSNSPTNILILNDIQPWASETAENIAIQHDIESIVAATLDFCKTTYVVLQTRKQPVKTDFRCVRLSAFDEADTATYLRNHEKATSLRVTKQLTAQIFQHTDGVPTRIDSVLIDANIVGIRELHTLNSDVVSTAVSVSQAPPALVAAVSDLENSQDPSLNRAFALLKTLAVFPKGERLETVKRFHQKFVFYPQDVHVLVERGLIDVTELSSFSELSAEHQGALLVVKRPVREYLHARITSKELASLNKNALKTYFGNDWQLKGIKAAKGPRFDQRNCSTWQITNAAMMVLRFAKEAIESNSEQKTRSALDLTTSFYSELISGGHYNNIVTSSEQLIPLFETCTHKELNLVLICAQRARSLRMTSELQQAREAFLAIKDKDASKPIKLQILLGLAIAHKGLGEEEESVATARECIRLDPRSNSALQARTIVAGAEVDPILRESELTKIEATARKRKAFVIANNIALDRAVENDNADELKNLTQNLYKQARIDGDQHNSMRAILKFAEASIKTGSKLSAQQIEVIIEIYHYLYGESFSGLFNSCHDILWKYFYKEKQLENLFRLFRMSSISWRFRGQERMERKYLSEAKKIIKQELIDYGIANLAVAYFFSRSSFLLK